ncbi:hypothetical protein BKA70DRAFT_1417588 [Coprinopsis sp. MPI-PUGE-AT-0042]|nr:hypothetical protein BKA70DRAFT_1417588 [Coprinopsis sp. MPI-PUGE-AT-0042]
MSRSHFFCPPFSTLARLPAYHYDEKKYGYMMDPSIRNNWDALADTVLDVAVRLRGHVDRGAVLPHHPRGWGYHKVYQNPRKLQALMHASQDWFLVWMGVISFLVACSIREALLRRDIRKLQAWEKMLGEYPHLIPFVEQLGSSPITNFGMPGTPPLRALALLLTSFNRIIHLSLRFLGLQQRMCPCEIHTPFGHAPSPSYIPQLSAVAVISNISLPRLLLLLSNLLTPYTA